MTTLVVEPSRQDFCQLAGTYANAQSALDLPTIQRIAEGLMFVSEEKAKDYLHGFSGPLDTLASWVQAKETLEKLVEGISSEKPSIKALFTENLKHLVFPNPLAKSLIGLREVAEEASIYDNLNTGFALTRAFEDIKGTALGFWEGYKSQLNSYAITYEKVKALNPTRNIESALEMIMAEGEIVIAEMAETRKGKGRAGFNVAMPVNAMLYLFSQANKNQGDEQRVTEYIRQYQQKFVQTADGRLKEPLNTRINEAIQAAVESTL